MLMNATSRLFRSCALVLLVAGSFTVLSTDKGSANAAGSGELSGFMITIGSIKLQADGNEIHASDGGVAELYVGGQRVDSAGAVEPQNPDEGSKVQRTLIIRNSTIQAVGQGAQSCVEVGTMGGKPLCGGD
jgi:hypothetical protein